MTIEEVSDKISFHGNVCTPDDGEHDLEQVCIEVVSRLPDEVQGWFFDEETHVFFAGSGQRGSLHRLFFPAMGASLLEVRFIFISESLRKEPRSEVMFTVAHEIAHSRLGHGSATIQDERDADSLAASWGFPIPAYREETIRAMEETNGQH
jgi:hypothetical protein